MGSFWIRLAVMAVAASTLPVAVMAQVAPRDLAAATLEELMQIRITSASRKEQRADDVAAAVFVITQDDIRRSGMRTLPELLRLVPGVQVSQINSSNWAVSIRGFNGLFSNKLLVLIDGRSIYRRAFSGVFWHAEDVVLGDIDRIEVVRGPGGAVWGANAVNGVINIVTKSAADTQGLSATVTGGAGEAQAGARYGGTLGTTAYRVYSQATSHGATRLLDGTGARDGWSSLANGLRLDWGSGAHEWTIDGGLRAGTERPLSRVTTPAPGAAPVTDAVTSSATGTVLGRWTRRGDDGAALQVQSFLALSRRSGVVAEREHAFDAELQYHWRAGARHDLVAGGGYRFIFNSTLPTFAFSMTPASSRNQVANIYAQDEIRLGRRLRLTAGAKVERDTVAAWSVQPTVRVMWEPAPRHRAWASASRAVRTPSATDLAVRLTVAVVPGPGVPTAIGVLGNPDYRAERLRQVEAGYRFDVSSIASIDVTTFRGRYLGLPTNEPVAPTFEATPAPRHLFVATRFENRLNADTSGFEVAARLAPSGGWRLDGSYSAFRLTPHLDAGSRDAAAAMFDGHVPSHQWQLHAGGRLGPRTDVDAALYRVGRLRALGVPAYTRVDARVEVRLTGRLSAIAAGRNLLDPAHAEYSTFSVVATQVPRGADVQLAWRFTK